MTAFSFIDKAQRLITNAQGIELYNGLASLLCVAVFLYLFAAARKKKFHLNHRYIYFPLILTFFFGNQYVNAHKDYNYLSKEYKELTAVYQSREYKIVEGIVHVVHLEPEGGHDAGDIIQINGAEFELSCFSDTIGYNKTIVYGGILTEGAFARVYYYQPAGSSNRDSIILQIDLLEQASKPPKRIDSHLPCAG